MEVIYYLTSFTRGCFKRRLSHFSKLTELLQIEREWYIEMNAWAETMVNAWARLSDIESTCTLSPAPRLNSVRWA